ncbi:MAG: phosphoribosylanthranilate isomerase [Candidatus Omnitrophota bacterium]
MVKVKVCGITNSKDALGSVELGAWALGFNFYEKSPRRIRPAQALEIIRQLPQSVIPVGVFVNEPEESVSKIAAMCGLRALQFHGDEPPEYCRKFEDYKVIKAFRIKQGFDFDIIKDYPVAWALFDSFQEHLYGGSGRQFDWRILRKKCPAGLAVILSGGLNPGNIQRALEEIRPFAVDVCSGVETAPGEKSAPLLEAFFKNIQG